MKCGICGRSWPENKCKVITLTSEEKAYVLATTQEEAPDQYVYCTPCWRVSTHPSQGPQLISGIIQTKLKGNPHAENAARKYRDFLISKSKKPVS